MNTILIEGQFGRLNKMEGLPTASYPWSPSGSVRAWLPAPPVTRRGGMQKRESKKNASATHSVWISLRDDSVPEKALAALLVLAAASAIGYGFACLIDTVQSWPVINACVSRMLQ